jgi:hypothetical protein
VFGVLVRFFCGTISIEPVFWCYLLVFMGIYLTLTTRDLSRELTNGIPVAISIGYITPASESNARLSLYC